MCLERDRGNESIASLTFFILEKETIKILSLVLVVRNCF